MLSAVIRLASWYVMTYGAIWAVSQDSDSDGKQRQDSESDDKARQDIDSDDEDKTLTVLIKLDRTVTD
jgi:hypothetical protein